MAVRHTEENRKVHKGYKGEITGCGVDTTVKQSHWQNTFDSITCKKDGCKN